MTTDSDHNKPVFPNLARDIISDGPDQLWVADITYVTLAVGFAYVAVSWMPGRGGLSDTPSAARSTHG
ncbi:hypothetical protein NKI36_29915 [Mesorhizobium caraganae]|uniref:Uncharacterized protein n=1 Tax=Mesorhizobium caraganae TaxID=483206 RepID=A0ABV1Z8Q8_9HYPH